jgi:hypothetical protein
MTGPLPRNARGKRPRFHEDAATDRLITIILALTSEVSVLRDRLDTVEQLGEKAGWLGAGAVDGFVADQPTRERREAAREAYLGRVLHILKAEVEGLERDEDYWATIERIERGDD